MSQTVVTRVERIEIDKKVVKTSYKVFLKRKDDSTFIRAEKATDGFLVPDRLRDAEWLSVQIVFKNFKLDFGQIHKSKFATSWVIGVDQKPFEEENVALEDSEKAIIAYYIVFSNGTATKVLRKRN